jgi:hypothetical protein
VRGGAVHCRHEERHIVIDLICGAIDRNASHPAPHRPPPCPDAND